MVLAEAGLRRKLSRINLEALSRMGNQHLGSHPETLAMDVE